MNLYKWVLTLFALSLPSLALQVKAQNANLTQYVDPFIGTGGNGHTFPGAVMPFGMLQFSPDNLHLADWASCSGYNWNDTTLLGFSLTHLSGTGAHDLGDIRLLPFTGTFEALPRLSLREKNDLVFSPIGTTFTHKNEKAEAGFYSLKYNLPKPVDVLLTAGLRTGIMKFHAEGEQNLYLDLRLGLGRDQVIMSSLSQIDEQTFIGYRQSKGWAGNVKIYFAIQFDRKPLSFQIINGNAVVKQPFKNVESTEIQALYFFGAGTPVNVKVGISSVGEQEALFNLKDEIGNKSFETVRNEAKQAWEKELAPFQIQGASKSELRTFYTALYHSLQEPVLYSDKDGRYRGMDGKIHKAKQPTYSIFSLWDTYRGFHPLHEILNPERTRDWVYSLIAEAEENKRLPVWTLHSSETNCMIGFHSVPVITDYFLQNPTDTALPRAFAAINATLFSKEDWIDDFLIVGYKARDITLESVSKTLELSYDYHCGELMAGLVKDKVWQEKYNKVSKSYLNLWHKEAGFFMPKDSIGTWVKPFDPYDASIANTAYTEGNGFQYLWSVQHNMPKLIELLGGAKDTEARLDTFFFGKTRITGNAPPDVSGLMGTYAHGNEPSQHIAYLYNLIGKPEKCAKICHTICTDFYHDKPDGIIGNDDCGQMSAWYIWNVLGMYPMNPAGGEYQLACPLFPQIKWKLPNGKTITIIHKKAKNAAPSWKWNGKSIANYAIQRNMLLEGGTLECTSQLAK